MKLLLLLALTTIAAAAPRSRDYFADYLFRRGGNAGGCTKEELDGLADAGVDLAKTSLDCSNDANKFQLDEMNPAKERRGCSIDYVANPSCCSPGCDWIMELHCMSPVQMICKK